jgi:hypothetical protein
LEKTRERFIFQNGEIIPFGDAKVHALNTAMKLASSIYDAWRGYWNSEHGELYLFRLREHLERLQRSAKIVQMQLLPAPGVDRPGGGNHFIVSALSVNRSCLVSAALRQQRGVDGARQPADAIRAIRPGAAPEPLQATDVFRGRGVSARERLPDCGLTASLRRSASADL